MNRAVTYLVAVGLAGLLAVLLVVGQQAPSISATADAPVVLAASATWRGAVGDEAADAREAQLRTAIDDLRAATGSGWTGRQDDTTGYLAELSGGAFRLEDSDEPAALATALLDRWGPQLFGVSGDDVEFVSEEQVGRVVSLRGEQRVDAVPVVDGSIAVIADSSSGVRVTSVRGRLFPDLTVETEPGIDPGEAAAAARAAAEDGAEVQGEPALRVLPLDDGARLVWEVAVFEGGDTATNKVTEYFVDAEAGDIVAARPGSIELHSHTRHDAAATGDASSKERDHHALAAPLPDTELVQGQAVQVTGTGPTGRELSATGLQLADGSVVLVDTTVPGFDPTTGAGAVETYDAAGATDESALPGQLGVSTGGTVADAELIAGHAMSRYVYDFYSQVFGRNSWDGQGGSLVSTVNFGGDDFCNAFFSGSLNPPQMVYGNPCAPGGDAIALTFLDMDVAAHEVTHGVTDTSAGLLYTGQSGALNESFSDYFGNLIGNYYQSADTSALGEDICVSIAPPTPLCESNPDGTTSTRYLPNGTTFADYLYVLDPPLHLSSLGVDQDNGGVHLNSAIWNNATWSIRTRLAQIDQTSGLESVRARQFDQVMYLALTSYLTPTSGFLDARNALEQAAVALGVDPVVTGTIREVMDLNHICAGCADPEPSPAIPVIATPATQRTPVVSGQRITWMDYHGDLEQLGEPRTLQAGADPAGTQRDAALAVYAGDVLVTWEVSADFSSTQIVANPPDGSTPQIVQQLDGGPFPSLAGSPEGATWLTDDLYFMDPQGSTTTAPDTAVDGGLTALGTGAGTVAVGTDAGEVLAWRVDTREMEVLATVGSMIVAVDAHGDRVAAVTEDRRLLLFDRTTGTSQQLSSSASPFGVVVSDDRVVWAEEVAHLTGPIAESYGQVPDTDLYLYDSDTAVTYSLLTRRGQQGFPDLDGNRLVWVDAASGGDDIYTALLPEGL